MTRRWIPTLLFASACAGSSAGTTTATPAARVDGAAWPDEGPATWAPRPTETAITANDLRTASAPPPATLTKEVLGPIEQVSNQMWPGVPVVPVLQAAATDAVFTNAAGIPTFGVSGIFYDPDLGHIHGLNERIRVTSLMESRDFLYKLVKVYADQK